MMHIRGDHWHKCAVMSCIAKYNAVLSVAGIDYDPRDDREASLSTWP